MQPPFATLQQEYERLLSSVRITRPQVVSRGVDEIERVLSSYEDTAALTGIPAGWIGPTDCRESDCNPRCGIGQGDPWNRPFDSKADADRYYLHYDKIDVLQGVTAWTLPYACWDWERWNGFGPRGHGCLSGYLWSCTDAYDTPAYGGHGRGGKYTHDGPDGWDQNKLDPQPGAVAMYLELVRRHPSLAIGQPIIHVPQAPSIVPLPTPLGVHDAEALHAALNKLLELDPPFPDGDDNYDRATAAAVRAFQIKAGFTGTDVDGLAGPKTWAKIDEMMKAASP